MSSAFNSMLESLQTPETRHAALVHLPIALTLVGLVLALATAVFRKQAGLRWATVAAYLVLAVSAWIATESGEDAEHEMSGNGLFPAAYETLERHEENAEKVPLLSLTIAAIAGVGAFGAMTKKRRVRQAGSWLTVIGGAGLAGWVAWVGHLGGTMVYEHGVGTPFPVAADGGPLVETTSESPLPDEVDDPDTPHDPRLVVFGQVKPILEEYCMRCHNPARARRAGGLDQTTIAGMLAGGEQGPAVVPGRPEDSLLLKAARHELEDYEMPPDEDRLPDEKLAVIEQWILEGAVWPDNESASR